MQHNHIKSHVNHKAFGTHISQDLYNLVILDMLITIHVNHISK
jgi:hypothetical protein